MFKKIWNFIKPTFDYKSADQRLLSKKNLSNNSDYIVFVSFVLKNRRSYYVKYRKTIKSYRFYNRKVLEQVKLDYRFKKGHAFGEPQFMEETKNYRRSLLITCPEDCYLPDKDLFSKYAYNIGF